MRETGDFLFTFETAGELVLGEFRTGVDGVYERREGGCVGGVEETALLKQE